MLASEIGSHTQYFLQELSDVDGPTDNSSQGDPMDECEPVKDFNDLADIYWVLLLSDFCFHYSKSC